MRVLRPILLCLALSLPQRSASAQHSATAAEPLPTAEAIMARVAANQDRAEAERSHYVYLQHVHVLSRSGKTVMCEEITDSHVTPSASGSDQQLLKLTGKLLRKHVYITYTSLPVTPRIETNVTEDHDGDRDLVESMRSDLTNDKSKDGIGADLFPLTSKIQSEYLFQLIGREHLNGREVFHVGFGPRDKDEYAWKGDAYIDVIAYQPVLVRTAMARKIPFAVRTLLGTSLPGLGFTVAYAPAADGVWFPVSFGTEFKIHALFFFNREIILNAQNRDFEKTHVSSEIISGEDLDKPQ